MAGTETCDDCRQEYPGPAYYTFDEGEGCEETVQLETRLGTIEVTTNHDCTGNICPECSGDLEPDDPEDPRRLSEDGITPMVFSL